MTTPVTITHAGSSHTFNLSVADLDKLPAIVAGALTFLGGEGVSSESPEYLEALASAREQLGAGAGEEAEAFLAQLDEEEPEEDEEAESEEALPIEPEDDDEPLWLDDDDGDEDTEADGFGDDEPGNKETDS